MGEEERHPDVFALSRITSDWPRLTWIMEGDPSRPRNVGGGEVPLGHGQGR